MRSLISSRFEVSPSWSGGSGSGASWFIFWPTIGASTDRPASGGSIARCRLRRHHDAIGGAHCPSPSTNLAVQETEAAIMSALNRLAEKYRNVVLWHHRGDRLPFEEVGRRLGVSTEAAQKYWQLRPESPTQGVESEP